MTQESTHTVGAVRFEPVSGMLNAGGRDVRLRPRTASLLDHLVSNAGRLVSKDELLRKIWPDAIVTEDSIVQCVKEIRQALGSPGRELIRTAPRRGYAFVGWARPEVRSPESAAPGQAPSQAWILAPSEDDLATSAEAQAGAKKAAAAPDTRLWRRVGRPQIVAVIALLAAIGVGWNQLRAMRLQVFPAPLSIVVLPFAMAGGTAQEQDYFAMSLTDDLTNDISRIPHAVVIAHGTATAFGHEPGDLRQIGRELGVRYALNGSVRRAGEEVRLNVTLFDTQSGQVIWAERLVGNRQNLVALEGQVTQGLVRQLHLSMLAADVARGLRQTSANPDAYDLALRGWALLLRKQPETNASGRESAQEALRLDPRSAFAWSVLSKSYFIDIASRWMHLRGNSREEWLQRAEQSALKAYELDPDMFEAQGAYAGVLTLRGKLADAVALRERQMSRNPSDPEPYHFSAYAHQLMGEPAKAIALEAEAMRISPRDSWAFNFLGVTSASYLQLGEDDKALAAADKGIALRPETAILHALAAAAAANLGRRYRANAEIAEFRRLQPDYTVSKFRADYTSASPAFMVQREHFYQGLAKAGLP